jgi:hypothetical protein
MPFRWFVSLSPVVFFPKRATGIRVILSSPAVSDLKAHAISSPIHVGRLHNFDCSHLAMSHQVVPNQSLIFHKSGSTRQVSSMYRKE